MKLEVKHSRGVYPVEFLSLPSLKEMLNEGAWIITDQNVASAVGVCGSDSRHVMAVLPGETSKSIARYEECLRWLIQSGVTRKSMLVALGGGVIGDLGGFVAATCMRGVSYTQIPTTLLAQVDSAVGGKVAVDLPEGKNLVGAFYPPAAVHVCVETLQTLPQREFANGMAEVLKYGFIMDPALIAFIPENLTAENVDLLDKVVRRCIEHKRDIVAQDEFETTGLRAVLNFGHTVGHALEQTLGFQELLHGEAIAIGMVVEARLGVALGITPVEAPAVVSEALSRQGLPITHPALHNPEALLFAMSRDKKAVDHKLAFSLLTRIGECKLFTDVPQQAVIEALKGS